MKEFIERIRNAYEYEWAWANEPLFFKAFMVFFVVPFWLFKVVYCIVVAITSPLWIVPYMIYWIRRNKE